MIIKNINKDILAQNIFKSPLLTIFKQSVIQFDKLFHPVVLYENYLICIFMNINKILKMGEKLLGKLVSKGVIRPKLNSKDISL